METSAVNLLFRDLRVITGSVFSVISRSFGPKGQQVLLTSSTGHMTVTRDGASILSSLRLSHPVAKYIVDNVISFGRVYGDGCKTIVIYVHELLSAIAANFASLDFNSCDDVGYGVEVSKVLNKFIKLDLIQICCDIREFIYVQNCKMDVKSFEVFENPAYNIVRNCLTGLPAQIADHLANTVAAFLTNIAKTGQNFHEVLKFFDNFVFILPGQPFMKCHNKAGMFLQGQFCGQESAACAVKCVFMLCPIEGHEVKDSTDVVKVTSLSADSFMSYRAKVASKFLQNVKEAGVSLLLTTHRVPDYVVQICYKYSISILTCLDVSDITFITYITGKSPVTSVYESLSSSNVIDISLWKTVCVEGKDFVRILWDEKCVRHAPQGLFLCAPTDELCQQLKISVKKSLQLTRHCLSQQLGESVNRRSRAESDLKSLKDSAFFAGQVGPAVPRSTDEELHEADEPCYSKLSQSAFKNIVAADGYFEHVLCYFLRCYKLKDVSSHKKNFCCEVLIKMLLAAPMALFDSDGAGQLSFARNFLCAQSEVMESVSHAAVSGVNLQTVDHLLHTGRVDVLSIKLEAVFAAIDLVVSLLTIDSVLGVGRPAAGNYVTSCHHSPADADEME